MAEQKVIKNVVLRLKKHFGSNQAGEVASFAPHVAKHIMDNSGGEFIAELGEGEIVDVATKQVKLAPPPETEATVAMQLAAAKARIAELEKTAAAKK